MVPCGSSSGEHDYLRLCLVSLRNDPDQQWDNIADITVTSRHKSHNSKFNTAVINDRIITLRNDTINLIFLYTKTLISQVHLFSLSALFACDHNRLSSLHIDVYCYCCTVSPFGNHLAFYQYAPPSGVEVRNEEDCLQFTKVYFKKTRAKKERLL